MRLIKLELLTLGNISITRTKKTRLSAYGIIT